MFQALFLVVFLAAPARAETPVTASTPQPVITCSLGTAGPLNCIDPAFFERDVCAQIAAEARLNDLPPGFLARLLWQESRFDPNAVSPARAMGIAQFIASTARLRGLDDPFNPAQAIEASAAYLAEMTDRYGNVGLAAIGYNGGERRAEGWIARTGGLARETIDYVRIITGQTAETWRDDPPEDPEFALDGDTPFQAACEEMAAGRRISPLVPPPPPEPEFSPWGVQVAYGTDAPAARLAFERLRPACRRAARSGELELIDQARGGRAGSIVAARIGADSRADAIALCRAISAAGCICRAYRN